MQKPRKESADGVLVEAQIDIMTGGKPEDSIYRSEARGQRQLVMSESMPVWACKDHDANDAILRELGFEVGDPFPDDPLFRPMKLPEGWTKKGSSHDMHSDILDANGFARIGMFYKAAFYDRRADSSFNRRVSYTYDPRQDFGDRTVSQWAVVARAPGKGVIIVAAFECPIPTDGDVWDGRRERAENEAKAYIEEHYPDHMSPLAYWADDIEGERYTHPSDR